MHPLQRRLHAEDLVRIRQADEQRRYVASQRSGRIDANPHQIEAVLFALGRIPEGGCILADEVGLGKTIEAGLVLAQLLAEGAERILLVTPKALLGQWREELFTLFSISATEGADAPDLDAPGVYLVTRDFAGGSGVAALSAARPFDLCVIDEAHEVFAGIYKRYDRFGVYQEDSRHAVMAGRVRELLLDTPVLLLTATPIQNALTELWGLAQFVEPTGTLLGDLATFREMFCAGDDRRLVEGQERELHERVAAICQRTLRRQAQEFMRRPFVGRRTQLFEYAMSPAERALYDDVTRYLLEPGICAFRGSQRQLLLIGFHRRMASSVPALAASLERVALRLEAMLEGALDPDALDDAAAFLDDLEEEDLDVGEVFVTPKKAPPAPEDIRAELDRVRGFVDRARALPSDAKAQALVRAVRTVLERGARGEGSGKVVIFTESLTTQDYLRTVLRDSGLLDDRSITLFRGQNTGPRAAEALERWQDEVLAHLPPTARPSPAIATRLALVHEFRTRSAVFLSTEAGAKGLNLQFAGTLVNYDLPWNPQRIEQRIGRIHRYGQTRDVLVVNFAALDNEAERLTLEILTQKLDLFGTVLGASDEVLHEPTSESPELIAGVVAADFEAQLRRIYERARTREEIEAELVALRTTIEAERARFEETHAHTAGLIENRFDDEVKRVFARIQDELPQQLAAFDRDLERVVVAYLEAVGAPVERTALPGGIHLEIGPCPLLPEVLRQGFTAHVGGATDEGVEQLHLGHPLVRAAAVEARAASLSTHSVALSAVDGLAPGTRGRLWLVRVRHCGFAPFDELLPVAVLDGAIDPLPLASARALIRGVCRDVEALDVGVSDEDMAEALEELLFDATEEVSRSEQARFLREVEQIETAVEDRVLLLERRRQDALSRLAAAETSRDAAVGADARTRAERRLASRHDELVDLEARIDRLVRREDDAYTRWMRRAHERRSKPPTLETLFDVRFVLSSERSSSGGSTSSELRSLGFDPGLDLESSDA